MITDKDSLNEDNPLSTLPDNLDQALEIDENDSIDGLMNEFSQMSLNSPVKETKQPDGIILSDSDNEIKSTDSLPADSSNREEKKLVDTPVRLLPITSTEFIAFKNFLKEGNIAELEKRITANPLYLVNERDTPTIYQFAFRHNALHLAASSGRDDVIELILKILESTWFYQKFAPNIEPDFIRNHLLDFYINSPDLHLCTPLHLTVYKNHPKCCRLLFGHPKTVLSLKDKNKNTAFDVAKKLHDQDPVAHKTLLSIFKEHYVALLCRRHFLQVPIVKIVCLRELTILRMYHSSISFPEESTTKNPRDLSDYEQFEKLTLEQENNSRLDAFVGPMSLDDAIAFQKMWKYPKLYPKLAQEFIAWRNHDIFNGYFKQGFVLASENKFDFFQFVPFMNMYLNLNDSQHLYEVNQKVYSSIKAYLLDYIAKNESIDPAREKQLNTLKYYTTLKHNDLAKSHERGSLTTNAIFMVSSAISRFKSFTLMPFSSLNNRSGNKSEAKNKRESLLLGNNGELLFEDPLGRIIGDNLRIYETLPYERIHNFDQKFPHIATWFDDFTFYAVKLSLMS